VPGATLAEQGVADRDAVVLKKRYYDSIWFEKKNIFILIFNKQLFRQ
jgi:hypothetical protein